MADFAVSAKDEIRSLRERLLPVKPAKGWQSPAHQHLVPRSKGGAKDENEQPDRHPGKALAVAKARGVVL
jgi:hypothetical protein